MILKNLNFCNRQMIADKINAIISNVIYELFYLIIGRVTKTPMLLVHPMTEVIFFSICSSYHPFLFVCVFGEHVQCPCRCNKANSVSFRLIRATTEQLPVAKIGTQPYMYVYPDITFLSVSSFPRMLPVWFQPILVGYSNRKIRYSWSWFVWYVFG